MARINLTVPDELKASMDGLEEVNWSRVASEAFAREVDHRRMVSVEGMQEAIERLRAEIASDIDNYREAGRSWAKDQAPARHLRLLKKEEGNDDWLVAFINNWASSYQEDRGGDFWEECLGITGPAPADEEVLAFAKGAIEVWNAVSEHL